MRQFRSDQPPVSLLINLLSPGGLAGPFLPGSLSKDSGLDIDGAQPGSGDPLAGGLNSMGLGGRGFPAYGNQGMMDLARKVTISLLQRVLEASEVFLVVILEVFLEVSLEEPQDLLDLGTYLR